MIPYFSKEDLEQLLDYKSLIEALRAGFQEKYTVPMRHHHNYDNPKENVESTLLLMPAWQAGQYLGIKLVTVSPNNSKYNLPSIHGIYTLFDAHKGMPIAQMDAKTLTSRRTAAASALASDYLSRKDSKTLLIVGTGALAPCLIEAHSAIRPIEAIYVWGRNFAKAKKVADDLKHLDLNIEALENLEAGFAKADIISCATLSAKPLVFGKWLRAGQHLDLVGSFKPDMREADDEAIIKSTVFVDVMEGATKETGDIVIPLENGTLSRKEIFGDLFDLCRNRCREREMDKEITLFKSVGHALEDLAAAKLVMEGKE